MLPFAWLQLPSVLATVLIQLSMLLIAMYILLLLIAELYSPCCWLQSYILLIAELSGVDCAQIWSWQQSEVGATGVEETNAAWYEPSRHIWWWRRLSWGPDGDTTITCSTGHPNSGFCTELWNFYSLTANNRGGGALRAALGLVRTLKSIAASNAGYMKSSLIFPANSDQCKESFEVWQTLVSLKKMKKESKLAISTQMFLRHILVILAGAHCCQIIWNQWSGRSPLVGWPSSPAERKLIKITSALSPLLGTFSFPRLLLSKNKIVGLGTKITPFTIAKFSHHVLRKYYGKPK